MLTPGSTALMLRFGEIFLKSEPVKRQFLKRMEKNIRQALPEHHDKLAITITRGRILLFSPDIPGMVEKISRVFGIVDLSPAQVSSTDIDEICRNAVSLAREHLKPGTRFAVRARRDGVDGYSSQELASVVGSAIHTSIPDLTVDLSTPAYEIFIEARREGGLIYDQRIPGPGGLPYGTQGSAVSLLSAGIDSPVASWLMMKRGVKLEFLFIDPGRYGGADIYANVIRNLSALSSWTPGNTLTLYRIPAESFYDRIMTLTEARFRCVLCKHAMLRIAENHAKHQGHDGIVLGDNLGQVATQTLKNLAVISHGIERQIYRPLIGYDKEEIITLARRIGSFSPVPGDTSCSVVPPKPATEAGLTVISGYVQELGILSLADDLYEKRERVRIRDGEII